MVDKHGFRILSPTATLGYGFPEASLERGLARRPHAIAVDGGSTDPGPYYLGAGEPFVSRAAVRRDLSLLVEAARAAEVPLLVGTAGGAGARPHVAWTMAILDAIARDGGFKASVGVIHTDMPPEAVKHACDAGRLSPLDYAPALTPEIIDQTTAIVAQVGVAPLLQALESGFQLIVCGRAYDPAVFAAPAVHAGYPLGPALHMGKILECAAIAAEPGSGRDCVLGTLRDDHFILEALSPGRRFTDYSVAAHGLYEKSDPYRLPGPEGVLNLEAARYENTADGAARVSGTRFEAAAPPRIKLEGARPVGYRTISIAGVRDPYFTEQLDAILEAARGEVANEYPDTRTAWHVYGRDGVMGALEPHRDAPAHDLGLVLEVLGPCQETASAACAMLRSTLLHYGYPGRVATAGNLALPFSPSDIPCGRVYEFSIYHLMEPDADQQRFEAEAREIG